MVFVLSLRHFPLIFKPNWHVLTQLSIKAQHSWYNYASCFFASYYCFVCAIVKPKVYFCSYEGIHTVHVHFGSNFLWYMNIFFISTICEWFTNTAQCFTLRSECDWKLSEISINNKIYIDSSCYFFWCNELFYHPAD